MRGAAIPSPPEYLEDAPLWNAVARWFFRRSNATTAIRSTALEASAARRSTLLPYG